MRTLHGLTLAGLLTCAACAPKIVPAPVVTTPRFPEFVQPSVPPALATSPAIQGHDRGWRFFQSGDVRTAERELEAGLKLAPEFYPSEAALGYVGLARKDAKAAIAHFDRALELQGSYVPALTGRGQALLLLNRESEAIAAFGAALAVDPTLTDLQRRIEVLRFRGLERDLAAAREAARAGRADEAIRDYTAAIASSPDSAFLYRELAAVARQSGAADLAATNFRRAVELEPNDAASLAQLGELREAAGDSQAALDFYARSLAIDPNDAVEAKRDGIIARAELAKLPEEYRAIESASEVTRGDLAALIGVRLSALVLSMRSREPLVVTDVRPHWAETWIMAVARAGIIEPYGNHTFQPRTPVRRGDLAQAASKVLSRLGTPAQARAWQNSRGKFSDIGAGHLAYPAASVAVAAGVMTTAPDGSFQPARPVTGAEAVEAIGRLQALANPSPTRGGR
jgi:tetratricopeptide (TPR) repeat protein